MMQPVNDAEQVPAKLPPGARIATSVQYLLGAAYLTGAGGFLLTAAVRTGDYQGLRSPGLERLDDPKTWIPPVGPESLWNPLTWIFRLTRTVSLFIDPLACLAALFGVVYLLRPEVRAHRRAFTRLATGTVLCAALLAFTLTPYGMRLQTWLLD